MSLLILILLSGILIALVIIAKQLVETNRALSLMSNRIDLALKYTTKVVDEQQLHELKSVTGELNITRLCVQRILNELESKYSA